MSNSLRIQSYETTQSALEATAQSIFEYLSDTVSTSQDLILLLAGGSTSKVYTLLASKLRQNPLDLRHLALAMGDERWPIKNNTSEVMKTEVVDVCLQLGASWYELPSSQTLSATAQDFNVWLTDKLRSSLLLVTLGIGADGHTLGVNVEEDQRLFENVFLSEQLVVGYHSHSPTAQFPAFPDRITLTLSGLQAASQILGFVAGSDKVTVLNSLQQTDKPLHLQPAQILKTLPACLFTDQLI